MARPDQIENNNPLMSRRAFLFREGPKIALTVVATAVALEQVLQTSVVESASQLVSSQLILPGASEMVLGPKPWTSRLWWPIFEGPAVAQQIPRLQDDWWILHMHDKLNWEVFGRVSHTLQWGRDHAENMRVKHGDDYQMVGSLGFCHGYANASQFESEPSALKQYQWETFDRSYLEGFAVLKHAADLMIPIPTTAEAIRAAIVHGQKVVVDLPELPGRWYRALYGISDNGVLVRVTDRGKADKDMNINSIVTTFLVLHDYDPAQVHPVHLADARARQIPEVNEELINQILAG